MIFKRNDKNDCIVAGKAVADQKEKNFNGNAFVEIGVGLGKDENGEQLPIINVAVWDRKIPTVHKGDRVFACGRLKTTTKDNKTYYSMTADFIQIEKTEQVQELTEVAETKTDDLPF